MNYDLKTINEMKYAIKALKEAQKLPTELAFILIGTLVI